MQFEVFGLVFDGYYLGFQILDLSLDSKCHLNGFGGIVLNRGGAVGDLWDERRWLELDGGFGEYLGVFGKVVCRGGSWKLQRVGGGGLKNLNILKVLPRPFIVKNFWFQRLLVQASSFLTIIN